jgi:hypothetical protein
MRCSRLVSAVRRSWFHPDVVKAPVFLEFLDLEENRDYLERDLEQAIIDRLQDFLLELGKQKRITLDGDHFYIDLVTYNRLLRAFVLIDLKLGKLTRCPRTIGRFSRRSTCQTRTSYVGRRAVSRGRPTRLVAPLRGAIKAGLSPHRPRAVAFAWQDYLFRQRSVWLIAAPLAPEVLGELRQLVLAPYR